MNSALAAMARIMFMLPAAVSALAATVISDTIYTAFPSVPFEGNLVITAPSMTTAAGDTIAAWQQTLKITGGALNLELQPNDTATPPGTSYSVRYIASSGRSWTETWFVPSSATPLKVSQLRATMIQPQVTVNPAQITRAGANIGDVLQFRGTGWTPVPGLSQAVETPARAKRAVDEEALITVLHLQSRVDVNLINPLFSLRNSQRIIVSVLRRSESTRIIVTGVGECASINRSFGRLPCRNETRPCFKLKPSGGRLDD